MKLLKLLVLGLAATLALFVGADNAEACCGQLIDIFSYEVDPDIIDPCEGEIAEITGSIYEYYWAGGLDTWPMGVTIVVTDEYATTVKTITATVTLLYMGQSYGVDDDGDGLIDEDWGYPTAGVDDDGDGRVDEDGGVAPGDEYADYTFEATWDGTDDGGDIVPMGTYDLAITAQAGGMGFTTVYAQVVTTSEEPCCVEGGTVDIDPDTINKDRMGVPVTGHVMPPEGYMPGDVTGARIISIGGAPVFIEGWVLSPDEEGAVTKFSSEDVIAELPDPPVGPAGHGKPGRIEDVEICIEVDFGDGANSCALCDVVDVVDR